MHKKIMVLKVSLRYGCILYKEFSSYAIESKTKRVSCLHSQHIIYTLT